MSISMQIVAVVAAFIAGVLVGREAKMLHNLTDAQRLCDDARRHLDNVKRLNDEALADMECARTLLADTRRITHA